MWVRQRKNSRKTGGNEFSSRQNEYDQYNNQSTGHESNYCCSKNGTKAEWKSFRKVDATYESKGGVTAYLNLSLDGKTRELYINEVIPTLGNNRPEKGIAVSEDEWNILRLTNIERAKEGKTYHAGSIAKATAVRAKENVNNTQPAHTRPNGTSYKTAVPSSFKTTGLGENMYKCTKRLRHSLRCVDG